MVSCSECGCVLEKFENGGYLHEQKVYGYDEKGYKIIKDLVGHDCVNLFTGALERDGEAFFWTTGPHFNIK